MATNGALAASALASLGTPGDATKAAVASLARMRQVAARVDIDLITTDASQGYRSLAEQRSIFTKRYRAQSTGSGPFGDVRWWNGTRYVRESDAGPAAIPGTSNHGLGLAIDFQGLGGFDGDGYAWLAKHGRDFGWTNTEGKRNGEPWHWVYDISLDKYVGKDWFDMADAGDLKKVVDAAVKAAVAPLEEELVALRTAVGLVPNKVWGYKNPKMNSSDAYQMATDVHKAVVPPKAS